VERVRLAPGDAIAAAGGVALLVSMFLPWYRIELDVAGAKVGDTVTAWQAFELVDVLLLLVALVAIAAPAARAAGSPQEDPLGGLLLPAAGALGVVLVLFRLIDVPEPDIPLVGGDFVEVQRRLGIFVALLAAAAIAAGGGATRTRSAPAA
jgi:hypothetical protein